MGHLYNVRFPPQIPTRLATTRLRASPLTVREPMHELRIRKIVLFVFLAFLLSYGLSFGFQWFVAANSFSIAPFLIDAVAKGLGVSGPALAAFIVLWVSRKSVLQWLRNDLAQTSVYLWWLAIPLFTFTTTLMAFVVSGANASALLALLDEAPSLLGFFAFHIFVVGLLEELGWRAWLLSRLLQTQTPLFASFILAPIWCAWHLPKLLSDPSFAAAFALGQLAATIILTALWARYRGRTALATIAHGSFNAPIYFMAEKLPQAEAVEAFTIVVAVNAVVAIALLIAHLSWWRGKPAGAGAGYEAPSVGT